MEDNLFAAFSFSGRTAKASPRAHNQAKAFGKKKGGAEAPRVAGRGRVEVKRENVIDCGPGGPPDSLVEGSTNPKNVLGCEASDERFLPVAKVEKTEVEGETGAVSQVAGAIQVKVEKKETADTFSAPAMDDSPSSAMSKKRLFPSNSGKGEEGLSEDMEDYGGGGGGGLSYQCAAESHERQEKKMSVKRRSTKVSKSGLSELRNPPADWEQAVQNIRIMRTGRDAPVDLLGPEQLVDTTADAETQKFHVLVAAMISSQTRDAVTAAAMRRLHAVPGGLTVQHLAKSDISLENLEDLLKPVGFYRQKAKHLKSMAEILVRPPYSGSVPRTLDELKKLPGVGPKVGLLVLWVAFGMGEVGLIVDTNVRRVCCRLGWAPESSTPEQVREALESWLPKNLWAEVSFLLVGFGQQICKPIGAKCEECQLKHVCPSAFKCVKKIIGKKVQL